MKQFLAGLSLVSVLFASPVLAGPKDDAVAAFNDYRKIKGRTQLNLSAELSEAAQKHANDMVKKNYFSHTSKSGQKFGTRIKRAGFKHCYANENIAYGTTDGLRVIEMWTNSNGHNKNMLTRKSTHFGIGFAGDKWVLLTAKSC